MPKKTKSCPPLPPGFNYTTLALDLFEVGVKHKLNPEQTTKMLVATAIQMMRTLHDCSVSEATEMVIYGCRLFRDLQQNDAADQSATPNPRNN
jgi:hypothetical protein